MSFGAGPDGATSMMGNTPDQLAAMAAANGADAVGANCGAGPENFLNVARLFRQATLLPVWIKANAGLPQLVDGKTTFPMGPKEFAACVGDLIAAGANFIGGCCGTGPDHIRAVRKAVDKAISR
jgi:5-methyltetrahydrofolate--homocysteine methyltransferase